MKIEKLDTKYFVLKSEDIGKFLSKEEIFNLHDLSNKISNGRKVEGKQDNEYVVLNLDDDINVWKLFHKIDDDYISKPSGGRERITTIKRFSIDIVNAILSTKCDSDTLVDEWNNSI